MQISIAFDPKKDSAADVQAAVLRQYAVVSGAALADAAAGGEDEDTTGDTAAVGVTHDKDGVPYDSRIHSAPPVITGKGVWRKGRGVSKTAIAEVLAQLKAAGKIVVPGTTATTPTAQPGALPGLAQPGALPGLAPFTPPAPDNGYAALVKMVMDNHVSAGAQGRIDDAWLSASLTAMGVPNGQITSLQAAPAESVKAVHTAIAGALGIAA